MARAAFHPLFPLLLVLSACTPVLKYPRSLSSWPPAAPAPSARPSAPQPSDLEPLMGDILAWAEQHVGSRGPLTVDEQRFPYDCSGYVSAAYASVGIELYTPNTLKDAPGLTRTQLIHAQLDKDGRLFKRNPRPGDLVFFDDTWDRDGDGRFNDALTHVGLVWRVLEGGTVEILHLGNSGIAPLRMNLASPDLPVDPRTGEVLNEPLRRRKSGESPQSPTLSGQLFRTYGRLEW